MPRPTNQVAKLRKLISLAQDLLNELEGAAPRPRSTDKTKSINGRRRRSGKELASFRKMLRSERKRGVPVAEIAREHGVSAAYIYQIG